MSIQCHASIPNINAHAIKKLFFSSPLISTLFFPVRVNIRIQNGLCFDMSLVNCGKQCRSTCGLNMLNYAFTTANETTIELSCQCTCKCKKYVYVTTLNYYMGYKLCLLVFLLRSCSRVYAQLLQWESLIRASGVTT